MEDGGFKQHCVLERTEQQPNGGEAGCGWGRNRGGVKREDTWVETYSTGRRQPRHEPPVNHSVSGRHSRPPEPNLHPSTHTADVLK